MSVSDSNRSALAKAATAKDSTAVAEVAAKIAAGTALPTRRVTTSPLTPVEIGAALMSGAGARWAKQLARHVSVYVGPEQRLVPLGSLPSADRDVIAEYKMFEIKLLNGDWSPVTPSKDKPSAWMRAALRRQRKLFSTYAKRDAKGVAAAIAAIGRADPAKWSLLAYAMYRFARAKGLDVKIPRKYDF